MQVLFVTYQRFHNFIVSLNNWKQQNRRMNNSNKKLIIELILYNHLAIIQISSEPRQRHETIKSLNMFYTSLVFTYFLVYHITMQSRSQETDEIWLCEVYFSQWPTYILYIIYYKTSTKLFFLWYQSSYTYKICEFNIYLQASKQQR